MSSAIASFAFTILCLGFSRTDASRYGLLRVASPQVHGGASMKTVETPSARALAHEDFQILFRRLFSYESSSADSMRQLSMGQFSISEMSMIRLSMADNSMTSLSMAGLSMPVALSMPYVVSAIPETTEEKETTQPADDNHNNDNDSNIQGPGSNVRIQTNDGMGVGMSAGLTAAGFLLLVVAAVAVYKVKRHAAVSQDVGDELSVPTAV